MTLVEHLAELRRRLVISIIAVGLGAIGGFFLYNSILSVLVHPYCHVQHLPAGTPCTRVLLVTDPLEPFTLRLILLMILAFGIAFEFPVVLVSLELAGVLTSAKLRSWRRWAFLAIFVVAAVITPSADPFSMFAMAVPMYVFYEGAILVGRLLKR